MKTVLLIIIVALLGVIAYFMYQDSQKTPLERAASDVGDAIENVGKELRSKVKDIERSIEK